MTPTIFEEIVSIGPLKTARIVSLEIVLKTAKSVVGV
jgi:hypothetical protein